jgi:hypothetical protein
MIRDHVDIWAVFLLLFSFALFTRADSAAARFVRAKIRFIDTPSPVEVRVSPWRLNHFRKVRHEKAIPSSLII